MRESWQPEDSLAERDEFELSGDFVNVQNTFHDVKQSVPMVLGPTLLALRAYAGLLVEQPAIVAGDLNNHIRWDKPGKTSNHANAVAASAALGLVSAYHAFHELEHGAERHPTLYWRDRTRTGPTFHIDYIFVRGRQRTRCGASASARMPSGLLPA